jgi:hypothetical protein
MAGVLELYRFRGVILPFIGAFRTKGALTTFETGSERFDKSNGPVGMRRSWMTRPSTTFSVRWSAISVLPQTRR